MHDFSKMNGNGLAYFIGVICGDGYISSQTSLIEVKDEYPEFLQNIYSPIVEELFGKFPRTIPESNNKHAYRCYFNSPKASNLLKLWHIVSPKSFTICAPLWIKNGVIQIKKSFISGAIDADGDVSTKKNKDIINYPTIKLETRSQKFAEDIHKMLLEVGLKSRFGYWMKRGKPMYIVRLYGFEQLENFVRKVGFRHPYKNQKAAKILNDGIIRASRSTVRLSQRLPPWQVDQIGGG